MVACATRMGKAMTTQSILVLAGIVAMFAVFGVSLAWADFYTGRREKPAAAAPAAEHAPAELRRAA